ncbi:MAG: TrkH family potassium uptake protein [Treponema sp.]|nr:TrkH family potassium uptake protein [Candidatus Treponema scatequi]
MGVINFLKIISAIVAIVATTFIFPVITAFQYNETQMIIPFVVPMICAWFVFLAGYFFTKKELFKFTIKSSFAVVAVAWLACSLFGAVPFILSGCFASVTDAIFESVSGFSTTGATIFSDVESLPHAINLWRCETHWLGGMGIVALTVALLPLLGVGGFQLIKAETTGPDKGKITSKITNTAKALWIIYISMTVILFVALKIAGMDVFNALCHAFSTLGSGGFSTMNNSIAGFNSVSIEWILTVFMFLTGVNYSLIFYLVTGKLKEIRDNSEFKAYVVIVSVVVALITIIIGSSFTNTGDAIRTAAFQVCSIISTTGYSTVDFTLWVPAAKFLIFILFFIGGCSGSTGGGIKVVRWVVFQKQVKNEVFKMLHPHGIYSVRLNKKVGRKDVVFNVAAFMMCYAVLVVLVTFAGTIAGLEVFDAFSGALSMVGNVGPGFGALGPSNNLGFLPAGLKWVYMFAMLAGRLEIYTMIMFLTPEYWKR